MGARDAPRRQPKSRPSVGLAGGEIANCDTFRGMILAFGDCVIDTSCSELQRRGKPVRLEPRVYDVLIHLIENRDRAVTRHELLDALWPGEAVSDSVLPRCIASM